MTVCVAVTLMKLILEISGWGRDGE
eukprot:COSAG03_NODE_6013_length_1131_cov_0.931202_1_plen_24_part_10